MWKETIFALEVWGLLAGIVGICVLLAISLARPMPNGSRPKSSKELPCEVDTFERIDPAVFTNATDLAIAGFHALDKALDR